MIMMLRKTLAIAAIWLALSAPVFASQATLVTPSAPLSMASLASFLNAALLSVGSCNAGTAAPANGTGGMAFAGECWINTAANPWVFNTTADGVHWSPFGELNTSTFVFTPYSGSSPALIAGNNLSDVASAVTAFANIVQPATASAIGGVFSKTCPSHQWFDVVSTLGVFSCAQPAIGDISGWGTGVAAALAVNIGSAGAPVLFNGALGTPSSGTLGSGVTLGGVTMGLGSDATGDIYYNNGGTFTRLPKGSNGQVLQLVAGLPAWASGRQGLSASVTLYVNPSATTAASCNGSSGGIGSDSNSGTLAAPFLTPAHALNVAQTQYDVRLSQITIQYCDNNVTGATYPVLQDTANLVGAISGGNAASAQLIIQGNTTTPTNVLVQGSSTLSAFGFVGVTSPVAISYMQIGSSSSGAATTGHGIQADAHSMVYYSNITWGYIGTGYSHVVATYGSFVEQEGVESIIGGAALHWYADRVSQILTTGNTITCTGAPAFSSAFVGITNASVFTLNGAAFSGCGSATGTKYIADSTSSFGSGTADPNTLYPGNANGSVTLPAFGLSGIIVGGGGSFTGASAPMAAMPAMNGDCTITLTTGAIVCTKTNGTAFGPLATSTTGKPILGGSGTTSSTQNTSVQFVGLSSISATENNYFISPNAYTLKNFYINLSAAPGGSLTQTATIRVGGSNTALTCTVTGAATTCHDTTHSASVSASSAIDVGIQASSASAPATIVGWGVEAY